MSSLWQYSGVSVLKGLEQRRVGAKPWSVAIYSWPHGKVRRPFCLIYVRYALFKFKLNIILKQVAIRTILVKVKNNVWLIFKIMLKCVHRKYRYLELYIFSGLKSFKKCNNRIYTVVPTQDSLAYERTGKQLHGQKYTICLWSTCPEMCSYSILSYLRAANGAVTNRRRAG